MTSVIFPLTDLGTPNTWTALQTFSGGISVGNISSSGDLVMNVPSGNIYRFQQGGTDTVRIETGFVNIKTGIYNVAGISFSNQTADVVSGALTGIRGGALNLIANANGTTARVINLQTQTTVTAGVLNAATRLVVNAGAAQGAVGIGLFEALYFAGPGTAFAYGSNPSVLADASNNLILNAPSGQSIISQIAGTTAMTLTAVGLTHTGYVYAQGTNYIQSNPANPTGTTSTALVFMGLGSTVKLTPKFSGRVRIVWNATGKTATGLTFFQVQPAHGTGTPPTNGQLVGTTPVDLSPKSLQAGAVNEGADFTFSYVLTGLSITGTLYWFDLALATGNSSDQASITNISFYAKEF
jgi:hypothetical protein